MGQELHGKNSSAKVDPHFEIYTPKPAQTTLKHITIAFADGESDVQRKMTGPGICRQ